jgi:hypothetical protein
VLHHPLFLVVGFLHEEGVVLDGAFLFLLGVHGCDEQKSGKEGSASRRGSICHENDTQSQSN